MGFAWQALKRKNSTPRKDGPKGIAVGRRCAARPLRGWPGGLQGSAVGRHGGQTIRCRCEGEAQGQRQRPELFSSGPGEPRARPGAKGRRPCSAAADVQGHKTCDTWAIPQKGTHEQGAATTSQRRAARASRSLAEFAYTARGGNRASAEVRRRIAEDLGQNTGSAEVRGRIAEESRNQLMKNHR